MNEQLKAWVHWVKKNPVSDDQLALALAVEELEGKLKQAEDALIKYATLKNGQRHADCDCYACLALLAILAPSKGTT